MEIRGWSGTALRQICRAQQNDTQDLVGLAVAACEGLSPLTHFICHPHCHLFAHKSWPSLLYRRSAQEKPRYTTMGPHYLFLATSPFESTGKSHGLQLSQHNLLLAAAASNRCWLLQPDARNDTRKHMRFYRPAGKIIRIFGLMTAK